MKIGLHIVNITYNQESESITNTLKEIVQTCEKKEFYSIWPMDHFFQTIIHGPPEREMLESYTTMAIIAGKTKKIKIRA